MKSPNPWQRLTRLTNDSKQKQSLINISQKKGHDLLKDNNNNKEKSIWKAIVRDHIRV